MGLYLCVFENDEEVEGVEVGSYADFGAFRGVVRDHLEGGIWAARFPVLMEHSDCDGIWTPAEAAELVRELDQVESELCRLAPLPIVGTWRVELARSLGLAPRNLCECFFDVDGEPLVARLKQLCRASIECGQPILFQ
jgi:hypothetical protein